MPNSSFPYLGSWGYSEKHEVKHLVRVYDDLTYRRYLRAATIHRKLNLQFNAQPEARKEAIKTFWDARMLATTQADFEFFCWNPEETLVASGATGRWVGIFDGNEIEFTRSGLCRWNFNLSIYLLARG